MLDAEAAPRLVVVRKGLFPRLGPRYALRVAEFPRPLLHPMNFAKPLTIVLPPLSLVCRPSISPTIRFPGEIDGQHHYCTTLIWAAELAASVTKAV